MISHKWEVKKMGNQRINGGSAGWIYCHLSSSFLCSFLSHEWPEYSSLHSLAFDAKLMTCNSFHFVIFLLIFCCQLLFGCLWFNLLPSPIKVQQSFYQQQFNNIHCVKKNCLTDSSSGSKFCLTQKVFRCQCCLLCCWQLWKIINTAHVEANTPPPPSPIQVQTGERHSGSQKRVIVILMRSRKCDYLLPVLGRPLLLLFEVLGLSCFIRDWRMLSSV